MRDYVPSQGRGWRTTLVVFLLLVLLIAASWGSFYFWTTRVLQQQIEQSRALGYPVTAREVNASYARPPADVDGTDLYLTAISRLQAPLPREKIELLPWIGHEVLPAPAEPLPEDMKQALAEYLAANQEAADLLLQTRDRPQARFPVEFEEDDIPELPHLAGLRQCAFFLSLAAIHAADAGDPETATAYLLASVRVGEALADEPLFQCQFHLVGNHLTSMTALQQTLHRTTLNEKQLAAIQIAFEQAEKRDTFHKSFLGERVLAFRHFKLTESEEFEWLGEPSVWTAALRPTYTRSGLANIDRARYIQGIDESLKVAQMPVEQRLAQAARLQSVFESLPPPYYVSRRLLWSTKSMFEINARDVAGLRSVIALLAVERYRRAQGRLPTSLETLVGAYLAAVPIDPHTGQPLRYVPGVEGYAVYSLGENGRDDNGLMWEDAFKRGLDAHQAADIGLRMER